MLLNEYPEKDATYWPLSLRHMETKVGKEKIEMLSKIADDVAETIDQFVAVSPNEAKLIDRRLRVCMNPAKNPDSALWV